MYIFARAAKQAHCTSLAAHSMLVAFFAAHVTTCARSWCSKAVFRAPVKVNASDELTMRALCLQILALPGV